MDGLIVRPAEERDVLSVLELQRQWQAEGITWGFVADTEQGIRDALGSSLLLVAEAQGCIVGYALGSLSATPPSAALPGDAPCLEVADLYVVPACRAHGAGGRLLDALRESARARGARSCHLYSGTKDTARIQRFYARHGFQVVGIDMVGGLP